MTTTFSSILSQTLTAARAATGSVSESLRGSRVPSLQAKYEEWRRDRDMACIMAAFYKLSDRHLAMIGIYDRDEIYYRVAEMIAQSDERKQIAEDVARILDEAPEVGETPDLAARKDEKDSAVSVAA